MKSNPVRVNMHSFFLNRTQKTLMKRLAASVTLLLLFSAYSATAYEHTLREFKGDRSTVTAEFTVESPWLLDWRLDADYEQVTALDISLIDAQTGRHVGRVLNTKHKGNGLKLFEHSGQRWQRC